METRKIHSTRFSPLPADFLTMVSDVLSANFEEGLKAVSQECKADARFVIDGKIHPDEILVVISLVRDGQLAATTLYASADFDPKASSPTLQDLLGACVDAAGAFFTEYLDPAKPQRIHQICDEALASLEDAPFDWTPIDVERFHVFLKVDKANPSIDRLTEEWLNKNDPTRAEREEEEHEQTEKLFVTGEKAKSGRGTLH